MIETINRVLKTAKELAKRLEHGHFVFELAKQRTRISRGLSAAAANPGMSEVAGLKSKVGRKNQSYEHIRSAEAFTVDCRLLTVFMSAYAASLRNPLPAKVSR